MTTTRVAGSQKRLRSIAGRAVRVVERQKALDVGVAAVAATLVPAAEAFMEAYDAVTQVQASQRREMKEGRSALVALVKRVRACVAMAHAAGLDFDSRELTGNVDAPDRLLSDANRVVALFTAAASASPQFQPVLEALQSDTVKASEEWAHAQAERVDQQSRQAQAREYALAFQREVVALRRVLRTLVGTSHLDYQALRNARVRRPTEPLGDQAGEGALAAASVVVNSIEGDGIASNRAVANGAVATGAVLNGASAEVTAA